MSSPNPLTRIERKKKKYKGYIDPNLYLRFVMDNYRYCQVEGSWVDKSYRRVVTNEQMLENYKMTL